MRILNLYYYFFYKVYLRLYLPKRPNLRYRLTLGITLLLLVIVIQCIIGNIAVIAGPQLVSEEAITISIPLSAALASLTTYITLFQKDRGQRSMEIFKQWPPTRHRLAKCLLQVAGVLLILDAIWLLTFFESPYG